MGSDMSIVLIVQFITLKYSSHHIEIFHIEKEKEKKRKSGVTLHISRDQVTRNGAVSGI